MRRVFEQRGGDGDQLADLLVAQLHAGRRLTQSHEPVLRRHPCNGNERMFAPQEAGRFSTWCGLCAGSCCGDLVASVAASGDVP